MKLKSVLTIAGFDPIGGAGEAADVKTITMHNLYAMSVLTLVSVQNTKKFSEVVNMDSKLIEKQLEAIFSDIIPDSTKIGMILQKEQIITVANYLKSLNAKNIVLDPVMVTSEGEKLLDNNAFYALTKYLFPISDIITPNSLEGEILSEIKITNKENMKRAIEKIYKKYKVKVLLKSPKNSTESDDLFFDGHEFVWINSKKIKNKNTRGTGDSFSSAIACNLAKGNDMLTSIRKAKKFVTNALDKNLDMGHGKGAIDHMYLLNKKGET
ncbi:MAG: bifunctional hydroxymethylpyrimidine kinase/phosphomethylpyrimidine kinase [Peptoniphilaceae bacterium]|nr:bifunctional hydroxymethylpyrimidine kinase/phosphomethylpyrimidine kinase [Peptoniphilaceae bacterium]MDY3738614.1 bifunctional hydroxymethylpyrimidine kinase/phosphomethylpyrimidine kinase [Peptoniphilaceae bacterium]